MLAWLASTLAAAFLAIQCASAATPVPDVEPESTAKIGILAFRPKAETLARWHPLVEHLNRARLKQQFALEAYSYDELEKAIHDRKVDVVLTQPAHYIMMKYREDLYSPLATLVESEGGKAIAAFGGVIFTLERRTDLRELKDLQGKRIATSSSSSLGGYLVQAYELKRAGIELPKDAQVTQTGMPHDNVVSEVLAGRADAGFVRTGVLEAMANEGKIDLAELRVLHRNRGVQYPYMLSTELFPEWALAAMPWADGETSRQVAAAVLGLPHDGKVAKAVRITGFTIPGDYRKVDDVMRELRVPPFDKAPEFSFLDALVRYRERFLLGAAVVFTMLSALIVLLMRSNRSLARERESIHKLAFYDALTGLPNRRLLLDRLRQEISQSGRRARYSAVLFIDLDNFKTLNDTQGHQAGDELLIDVARRLRAALREGDTVARLGGDEFVLVLCDLGGSMEGALESIRTIAGKLLAAIQADLVLGSGERYRSSASIGVCPFLGDQVSVDELLKRADTAMYQAKSAGRSGISFFDPSMQHMLEARLRIESWMRESIGQHFVLFYQPQVEGDGKPTGAEALVRWMHPEHGLISPATFIPLAEETGLILQIGEWVLRSACLQIAKWETHPVASRLSIAVNVSAKQFKQPDFVEMVLATLHETSASPSRLKLELTESMLVSDVGDVATKMARLKEVGVTFSLDDFGTGYASLSVLKTLPFDQVKIDQSFVKELLLNRADAAIARTVITLGDSLDINVIAEGVETEAHRNTLAAMNCNFFQGYYFAKPMPVEDFEEWIRAKDAPAQRAPASA